jgi:dihydroxyacid dehydratase/phosphogluconate dehydratase
MLTGNLGKAVIKISAVKPERHVVEAPARVFHTQEGLQEAFKAGELTGISSPWCASRDRRPTACRNCTS